MQPTLAMLLWKLVRKLGSRHSACMPLQSMSQEAWRCAIEASLSAPAGAHRLQELREPLPIHLLLGLTNLWPTGHSLPIPMAPKPIKHRPIRVYVSTRCPLLRVAPPLHKCSRLACIPKCPRQQCHRHWKLAGCHRLFHGQHQKARDHFPPPRVESLWLGDL